MIKKSFVVSVMTMCLALTVSGCGLSQEPAPTPQVIKLKPVILHQNRVQSYSMDDDTILNHIKLQDGTNDECVNGVVDFIQKYIDQYLWNVFCSENGQIVIVDGYSLINYRNEEYQEFHKEHGDNRIGVTRYIYNDVTIVVATKTYNKALEHEFCHVLDDKFEYSETDDFLNIYSKSKTKTILKKMNYTQDEIDYFSSKNKEFFAETYRAYLSGQLHDIDYDLERFYDKIPKSIDELSHIPIKNYVF